MDIMINGDYSNDLEINSKCGSLGLELIVRFEQIVVDGFNDQWRPFQWSMKTISMFERLTVSINQWA